MLQRAGGAPDADATAIEIAERFSMDELAALIQPMADLDFRMRRSSIPQLPLEIAMVEGAGRGSVPMRASQPAQTAAPDPHPVAPPVQPQERAPEQRVSLKDRVRGKPSPATDFAPAPQPPPSPREGQPVPESRGPEPAPDIQPATVQRVAAAVGTGPGGMTLERIVELWPQIRADVKALNRRIEALLQQVDPAAVTGSKLVLVSPYEFHRNRVNNDDVRQVIEGVVGRLLGDKVQVSCVSREEVQSLQRVTAPQAEAVAPAGSAGTAPVDSDAEAVPEEAPPREGSPLSEEDVLARLTAARNIFDADDVVN
jgi:DNA polymerase-3 subunit gamma/tau